jgi:hypothetical protein
MIILLGTLKGTRYPSSDTKVWEKLDEGVTCSKRLTPSLNLSLVGERNDLLQSLPYFVFNSI